MIEWVTMLGQEGGPGGTITLSVASGSALGILAKVLVDRLLSARAEGTAGGGSGKKNELRYNPELCAELHRAINVDMADYKRQQAAIYDKLNSIGVTVAAIHAVMQCQAEASKGKS